MSPSATRKGAVRAADISPDVLKALSTGAISSLTLTECLALDQTQLARAALPALSSGTLEAIDAACTLGILKRMQTIGQLLLNELGPMGLAYCQAHPVDTVRGWACFMIGAQTDLRLAARLDAIRPLADDAHFGVREWAWMAVRPYLAQDLPLAIELLHPWTQASSDKLRRFACEALRPRGVWCSHINALKQNPELALAILTPLRADTSVYVQDSVANWLNDAAKTQADWVRSICAVWLTESPHAASERICKRGMRSL